MYMYMHIFIYLYIYIVFTCSLTTDGQNAPPVSNPAPARGRQTYCRLYDQMGTTTSSQSST